ncbi:O-acetyl-ADP-ribose deacetylase [Halomonas sp. WWR20]
MVPVWKQERLHVVQGDITTFTGDAIVNAANRSLLGGGGVDGAIHRAAGPELLEACRRLRETDWPEGLPVGEVALTPGFRLSADYVIHTVGPVYAKTQDRSEQLAACYRNALALAAREKLHRLAFPAISTGIYGYPEHEAARVVWDVIEAELPRYTELEVTLVFFSSQGAQTFLATRP